MVSYFHNYIANGKCFPVTEQDRVVVKEKNKDVQMGYNHARAWRAAYEEALDQQG